MRVADKENGVIEGIPHSAISFQLDFKVGVGLLLS
jgi:hypothetical protein